MSKVVVFRINHCCLCDQNEMRLDKDCEYWCKLENKQLNDTEYADFPGWCPKRDAGKVIDNPDELVDLEEYLIERDIIPDGYKKMDDEP